MATFEEIQELATTLNAESPAEPLEDQQASAPAEASTPEPEPEPEPVPFKPQLPSETKEFMELARRERTAREVAQENKKLALEIAELRGAVQARASESPDLKEEARQDPLGFIKKHGITYEDLTNTIINGEKPTQSLEMRSEIEGLRSELSELQKAREKEAERRRENEQTAAYNKFIDEINDFVENNTGDCELIRLQGAHQLVGEVIRDNYAATGRSMSYKQACTIVENHLEKQVRSAMRSSKFKPRAAEAQPAEVAPPVDEAKTSARPKTLTNQNTASPAHVGDGSVRPRAMSRDDSLKNLAKSINFWG